MEIILLTICISFIGVVFIGSVLSENLVVSIVSIVSIVSGLGFFLLFIVLLAQIYFSMQDATKAQIEQGRYYTEECHILETNIEINLVYPYTNKLQCGPIIDYVDIKSYREAIKAYQESLITK